MTQRLDKTTLGDPDKISNLKKEKKTMISFDYVNIYEEFLRINMRIFIKYTSNRFIFLHKYNPIL